MADHSELVSEITIVEKMPTQDRLKHARKRRSQQLKRFANYEKQLEKQESSKKKKHNSAVKKARKPRESRVVFPDSVMLLEGAARNDVEEVRKLLTMGVTPDVTNEDGLTALHQCCIDDSEDMLLLLLEFGASVNARDSELWTPLHAAATCGHVHLCKHLIDKGAELLAVNADGNMPYDICEDEVTLDYIEQEMAKRGITQQQIDDTRLVVEKQMLEDIKKGTLNMEHRDVYGATPLHIGAANGYLELIKYLLDNNVSVDVRDAESWQPIHAAACWMQPEVLEMLVQHGADLDAKTRSGETAFDICEDPEMKQKILDMKDEIETNKASKSKDHSMYSTRVSSGSKSKLANLTQAHTTSHSSNIQAPRTFFCFLCSSSSIRRSSLRGEKSALFMKEAKEEALHFGLGQTAGEEDNENEEEDPGNLPMTNIDDVELQFDENNDENNIEETVRESHVEKPKSETLTATDKNANTPPQKNFITRSESRSKRAAAANSGEKLNSSQSVLTPQQNAPPSSAQSRVSPNQPSLERRSPDTSAPVKQDDRQQSGTPTGTLANLKKQRAEVQPRSRDNSIDAQVQNMFLDSLNNDNKRYSSGVQPRQPVVKEYRNQNGHNNNKTSAYPTGDVPLRRFTAPGTAPVVGDEEKPACCILM
ncbi:hypothetical protein ScPMuIL_001964 [Solemya velum]